jgi:hypothetical protein
MTQATDTDIRDIKTAIEANTKAIGDLKDSISSLREETRVGLTRLDADIRELRSEVKTLDIKLEGRFDKLDERTKVGFWGFILRGTVLAIIIGVDGYLLPIVAEYVHKLPPIT